MSWFLVWLRDTAPVHRPAFAATSFQSQAADRSPVREGLAQKRGSSVLENSLFSKPSLSPSLGAYLPKTAQGLTSQCELSCLARQAILSLIPAFCPVSQFNRMNRWPRQREQQAAPIVAYGMRGPQPLAHLKPDTLFSPAFSWRK